MEVYIIWLFVWSKTLDTTRLYPFIYFIALAGLYFTTWFVTKLTYAYNWQYAYISIIVLVLFCIVLFNTNVESPTYIIPFVAVATWFLGIEKNYFTIFLFVFCFILTSFSPSDLFPKYINQNFVRPYALKALPCFFIWLDLTYRLLRHNFDNYNPSYLIYKYDSK